jgi:hypothetical protein
MSWWKTARPGDKVVCVESDRSSTNLSCPADEVICGHVYTVVVVEPDYELDYGFGVVLKEKLEANIYSVKLFRPVQTKSTETGMAILRKLLTGKRARQRA